MFEPDQIVSTITRYLQTKKSASPPYNPYSKTSSPTKRFPGTYSRQVNAITTPSSPIELDMDILRAAIKVLEKHPQKVDQACLICLVTNPDDSDHTFGHCPVLKDHEFLKSAYIKCCINARRMNKEQAAAFQKTRTINSIASMSEPEPSIDDPKVIAIQQILGTIDEGANEEEDSDFR